MKKSTLLIEFVFIFVIPPLLVVWGPLPKEAIMPILWLVSLYAYLLLRSSKIKVLAVDFSAQELYDVLKRFFMIGSVMILFVLLYEPERFLALPIAKPWQWLAVILFYPLFSAFVQELLFRNFFFHRYEKLFKGRYLSLIVTNALVFAYVHVVFENWIAVIFTFFGGFLFAHTYLKSRSTLLTAIEHSLYGDLLYTIGLGYYFYHGANL